MKFTELILDVLQLIYEELNDNSFINLTMTS